MPTIVRRPDYDPLASLRSGAEIVRLIEQIAAEQRKQQRL